MLADHVRVRLKCFGGNSKCESYKFMATILNAFSEIHARTQNSICLGIQKSEALYIVRIGK